MSDELQELTAKAVSVTQKVERLFGDLNSEQLNWKPSHAGWSVAQCLEHLIITNHLEFPAIKAALEPQYKNPFWSKVPVLPDIFGKVMIWLFKPDNPRKFKAPKSFQPSKSEISDNIVKDFATHQKEVVEIFEKSKHLDLQKTKIVSPVSDLITYSLLDSYKVLVGHEERHLQQAARVLGMESFPR